LTNPYGASPAGGDLSWQQITTGPPSALSQAFLTGNGWNPARGSPLPQYFKLNLTADGRPIYAQGGLAMMVDAGDPGAAQAWGWFVSHVYHAIPAHDLEADPKWAIVPRPAGSIKLPDIAAAAPRSR
jgi:hypothetical protein